MEELERQLISVGKGAKITNTISLLSKLLPTYQPTSESESPEPFILPSITVSFPFQLLLYVIFVRL